jgi:hypothetical protein
MSCTLKHQFTRLGWYIHVCTYVPAMPVCSSAYLPLSSEAVVVELGRGRPKEAGSTANCGNGP